MFIASTAQKSTFMDYYILNSGLLELLTLANRGMDMSFGSPAEQEYYSSASLQRVIGKFDKAKTFFL